jgi:hypothetical protein
MKHHRLSVLAVLVFFVAPCFAHHMAVIVDKDNKVGNVSSVHLAKVFRTEIKKWPDGRDVVLVFHTAAKGEKTTLQRLLKMSDSDLQSLLATHKNSIKMAATDAGVIDLVECDSRSSWFGRSQFHQRKHQRGEGGWQASHRSGLPAPLRQIELLCALKSQSPEVSPRLCYVLADLLA